MQNNPGPLLACLACLVPFALGGLFAWWLRGRVVGLGLPGAFLPGFIRRWIEEVRYK